MRTLFLLFLLLPVLTSAQNNHETQFDKYMDAQVSVDEFSGTALIAQKGKIIFEKAFGLADREWEIPTTINTKFQIGSLTKQFTAVCILQLAEQGKISLDDKLSKYLPAFPKADIVTIHMLLSHTSGIKGYTSVPEFSKVATVPLLVDSMVSLIARQPYEFSPGKKWNYSNSGYFLLGVIIEKVSGLPYSDYVLNNVIKKVGLANTFVNRWDTILSSRAKGYFKEENEWYNADYISMEGPYSAGAIISDIEDLYKWNNALFANQIIQETSLKKMTTPYMNHYGYGLGIDTFQHHLRIGHSGGIPGFVSYMARFPKDSVVVIVLSNNSSSSPAIANALVGILFDLAVITPYKHKETKIDSAYLDTYIGKYMLSSSDTLEIFKKDGILYRQNSTLPIELKPESKTMFFYGDESDRQIEFQFDKSGKVVTAFFINGGIRQELRRL